MGLFDNIKKNFQPPQQQVTNISSIMPVAAIKCINNGQLPQINTNTVSLSVGDYVHYIERAVLVTEKNIVTGYTGSSNGWSFRVFKGVSYRTGKQRGLPIREDIKEQTKGILFFTSKRVIFVAKRNGFDKKINTITAIMPHSDGIGMQIGNKAHTLLLPDGNLAFSVFRLLKP